MKPVLAPRASVPLFVELAGHSLKLVLPWTKHLHSRTAFGVESQHDCALELDAGVRMQLACPHRALARPLPLMYPVDSTRILRGQVTSEHGAITTYDPVQLPHGHYSPSSWAACALAYAEPHDDSLIAGLHAVLPSPPFRTRCGGVGADASSSH
ncbi:hypothetical protein K438DRAFT_1980895 [Mycena galopus ATCC 62051]|nr:hypothetical protein K438DRAFT_1980895 [Mycena galopus ATCC 62051]